jgi:class 3 adenylate cyclase
MLMVDGPHSEFLQYAPAYAKDEAAAAIDKVTDLQSQGLLRKGVYYLVLVDLVGSTKFGVEYGNTSLDQRIQTFVTSSITAISHTPLSNTAVFLKEIGDAVLLIFQHFPDVLRWYQSLLNSLRIVGHRTPYVIRACVHLGEVHLNGVNPLSIAVSQTFKMEKAVPDGEMVLSEPAYQVAWPTIARAYRAFESAGEVELEGMPGVVGLHRLDVLGPDGAGELADEESF